MFQDAHIHLQNGGLQTAKILSDAREQRCGRFFCNGSAPSDWNEVRDLAASSGTIVPFYGVHPWYVDEARDGWDAALLERLKDPKARIGEIGLDSAKKELDINKQREVFSRQIDIAVETGRSFAVHCVHAWEMLVEELDMRKGKLPGFMIHWFSGSPEVARELVRRGAYLSFSPRLLYERAKRHRAAFDAVPLERILLETDYPYLPDAVSGDAETADKYFEWLKALYGIAAHLKSTDEESFIDKVWENGTIFLH